MTARTTNAHKHATTACGGMVGGTCVQVLKKSKGTHTAALLKDTLTKPKPQSPARFGVLGFGVK